MLFVLIVVAIVLAAVHHDEKRYRVPSESMQPTIHVGDKVWVDTDAYFMLGDNRGASDDSRFWGPVPQEAIVGRVEGH